MTDAPHKELVVALRTYDYWLCEDAADAIEALVAENERLERELKFRDADLNVVAERVRAMIKNNSALRAALKEKA